MKKSKKNIKKIKNSKKNKIDNFKRLFTVAFFLFFFFSLIIARFYKLQIIEGDDWAKKALKQHKFISYEPFMRGRFYSNNTISQNYIEEGQPFVLDILKFHLFIDPISIPNEYKDLVAKALIEFFQIKDSEKIKKEFFKKSRSRKIVKWIDRDDKERIEKWWKSFIYKKKIPQNAIFFKMDYKRSYPFNHMLGQVIHTVQELKDENYQAIPTGGLELYFNKFLQGKVGIKESHRSLRNPLDETKVIQYPQNGADIYLTINQYIQAVLEKELEKGVKKVNAKGGWAIIMDSSTGDIWGMAHYPFFDIKNYSKYFSNPIFKDYTKAKAITDTFEPASIFKPIILAICLKGNEELQSKGLDPLFYPMEKVNTVNGFFPGRKKPLKDGRLHKYLNMYIAIQKSSNIYMGQIVDRLIKRLGPIWCKNALESMFGFGKKTNIEFNGEEAGILPIPGKLNANGTMQWSLATPYSLAIGHNISVNSIQILKAYGAIANYGIEVQPTLLRKIVLKDENGKEVTILDKSKERNSCRKRRILSKSNAAQIINAMKFTTKLGGTAPRADIPGYTEAGKSGTSEKIINGKYSTEKYISSFVGLAPAKNPKFVLMIVIDEPEKKYLPGIGKSWHGGVCASPLFKEIGEKVLQYLGVEPDDPYGYPYGDKRRDQKKADWQKELSDMQKLYKKWNGIK